MKITIDENDKITVELDNGHVQTFPEGWQEDCVKAAVQREKAEGWEKRCEELEQELRDAQERLDEAVGRKVRVELEANQLWHRAEELKTALDKQVEKYEKEIKELRDQQAVNAKICDMWKTNYGEQEKLVASLQDRIREQDVTIAKYDDENRELKSKYIAWDRGSTALTRWARAIHENAVAHGWWTGIVHTADYSSIREDVDRPLPEILMLCVCELAESMEEYRNGTPLIYDGENGKPEGIAVEMADCIIRILDWMGHNGVDVDELIRKKHEYNKGRPYRHGGKKA